MERIAEIMQKVPACCLEDTLVRLEARKSSAVCHAGLIYDFLGNVPSICSGGTDGNTHFSEPLRRRCRWVAVSGVCLVPSDLPLFICSYSLGAGAKSDRLVDLRDEFCWLRLPSTRLLGRHGAELPYFRRKTKPTRANATGSPTAL
jgi:hypothetical protein